MDTAENRPVQPEVPPAPKNRDAGGRVILVQLFACVLLVLAAVCLRYTGGEWNEAAKEWYQQQRQTVLNLDNPVWEELEDAAAGWIRSWEESL